MTTLLKVATIVGTRPEIIKLSRVIDELDRHTRHVLIHTGQNYDYALNQVFFDQLGIRRPQHFLEAGGGNPGETIGNVIARSYGVLASERPDALLILGDTNSCLAAIAAKRLKIPVFHMEAGNRCFDERVPEEINRRIVDHVSDVNLVYTEHARRYLLREGLRGETVIKTGSPMREVLTHYRAQIDASTALADMGLEPHQYFLVSAHREENVDDPRRLGALLDALRALSEQYGGATVIFSTHPRTKLRLEEMGAAGDLPALRFVPAQGFLDYVKLELNARCVLSDSGTITEESAILGFPAVTMRDAHERPEGMDMAAVLLSGLDAKSVLNAVRLAVDHHASGYAPRAVPDYAADDVSKKVLRIILSYTDYVNRVVWKR